MAGLTLTRKLGEKILIGNDIVITISKLTSGRVSLSIMAPPEINIAREEVLDITEHKHEEAE